MTISAKKKSNMTVAQRGCCTGTQLHISIASTHAKKEAKQKEKKKQTNQNHGQGQLPVLQPKKINSCF